jgi:flagellar biogenesis protein FliO
MFLLKILYIFTANIIFIQKRGIMKQLFVILFIFFAAAAQERQFDMNALNQSMGIPLTAADTNFAGTGSEPREDSIGIIVLRLVGSLVLVLALVGGTAWFFRKTNFFKKSGIEAANQTPSMSVLEALATGQNGVILLVRCEEQVFLVGQTQAKYTLLQELNADTAKKIIDNKAGNETIGAFKSSLSNFMQNIKIQKA